MSKVIDYWESQVQKIALKEVSFTTDKMVRAYGEESNMSMMKKLISQLLIVAHSDKT